MKRQLSLLIAILAVVSPLQAQKQSAKKPSDLATVGKFAVYPARHPVKSLKGILYVGLKGIGAAADLVEKVTGTVAKGAAKADEVIDAAQDAADPTK